MSNDKMRAEFEKWAKAVGHDLSQTKGDDQYWYASTADAWQVWQAGYQAGQKAEREAIFIEWENGELLAKEVERLRAELAACQNLLDETRTELSICGAFHAVAKKEWQFEVEKVNRLEAELAAAKAASVVPVGITDLELSESGHRIEFYLEGDKPDGEKMLVWLRDRMKENQ